MAEKRLKTPGDEETSKADAEKAKIRGLNSFKSVGDPNDSLAYAAAPILR